MNDASPAGLTFKLSDDGKLLAEFAVCAGKPPVDEALIKEALVSRGLSNLFLYENSLSHLVTQYNNLNEDFVLEIGERRDGRYTLKIDDDKMAARLTLIPPYGGAPVTLFQIQLALQEKGVVSGIMVNEIEAALKENGACCRMNAGGTSPRMEEVESRLEQQSRAMQGTIAERIIAQGLHPVPGTDAQFQSLISKIRERKPQVDERGIANYRDLGQLVVVKQGDPIMRRTPPITGNQGQDITGQILTPQSGQDTQFASGLQGAELDPNDNNLLLAAITGQPKLVPNGVVVEPTISLPLVDISTGNVSFDGTINIKGDVKDGMKVYASGDVFVGGTVEAAEIEAGGNVVIKGGVIGHSEHSGNPNEVPSFNAIIISKGSISAHFAENACMEAGTDILIEELSMHNHLTALNQVLVGKSGGKKGHIIGGITCASALVKTAIIGSNAGFITKIRAGFNPYLLAQLNKLKLEIGANEKEQEDIKKIVTFVLAHPEKDKNGLLNKLFHTREKLEIDCTQLYGDQIRLLSEMTLAEHVQIIVEEAVHCGAEIQIGNSIWKNNEERGKGVFQIVEGKIDFGNIMLSVIGSH